MKKEERNRLTRERKKERKALCALWNLDNFDFKAFYEKYDLNKAGEVRATVTRSLNGDHGRLREWQPGGRKNANEEGTRSRTEQATDRARRELER